MRKDYGNKFVCYNCNAKFYDMGKPQAICPLCESDQSKRPKKKEKKSFRKYETAENGADHGSAGAGGSEKETSSEDATTPDLDLAKPVAFDGASQDEE